MTINASRLKDHFEAMSLIGQIGETGVCRPAHSALEKQSHELASSWMQASGLTTHIDNFGNLIGELRGSDPSLPVLMVGSHLDSQPYGGRFDGAAGVLCAIEAVATLVEQGIKPKRTIHIVSFADEEGWRFNNRESAAYLQFLQQHDHDSKDVDRFSLMKTCFEQLPQNDRDLLSSYCSAPTGRARAKYRVELAEQLNYTVTAMRVRVTRVRRSLDDCVKELSRSYW